MANIVLAWELGAERGHISRICSLAREFLSRGHRVSLLVTNHQETLAQLSSEEQKLFTVIGLPALNQVGVTVTREPCNFSELLLASGYTNASNIARIVSLWLAVFRKINPDLVLFEYAPAALLASRVCRFEKVIIGDGFIIPPCTEPFPSFIQDHKISNHNLSRSDTNLLQLLNAANDLCHLPGMSGLSNLYGNSRSYLCSVKALDPYADHRKHETYVGALELPLHNSQTITWNAKSSNKKIVAYLKPEYSQLPALLHCLKTIGVEAHIFIANASADLVAAHSSEHIRIHAKPLALDREFSQADFFICHGGHGYTVSCLSMGIPGIIIPLQMEQGLTAVAVQKQGWGEAINPFDAELMRILPTIFNNSQYRENLDHSAAELPSISVEAFCDLILSPRQGRQARLDPS